MLHNGPFLPAFTMLELLCKVNFIFSGKQSGQSGISNSKPLSFYNLSSLVCCLLICSKLSLMQSWDSNFPLSTPKLHLSQLTLTRGQLSEWYSSFIPGKVAPQFKGQAYSLNEQADLCA